MPALDTGKIVRELARRADVDGICRNTIIQLCEALDAARARTALPPFTASEVLVRIDGPEFSEAVVRAVRKAARSGALASGGVQYAMGGPVPRLAPTWRDGDVYLFGGAPRVRETRDGKSGWYDLAGRRCQTADPDEDFFADVPGAAPVVAVVRGGKRVTQ